MRLLLVIAILAAWTLHDVAAQTLCDQKTNQGCIEAKVLVTTATSCECPPPPPCLKTNPCPPPPPCPCRPQYVQPEIRDKPDPCAAFAEPELTNCRFSLLESASSTSDEQAPGSKVEDSGLFWGNLRDKLAAMQEQLKGAKSRYRVAAGAQRLKQTLKLMRSREARGRRKMLGLIAQEQDPKKRRRLEKRVARFMRRIRIKRAKVIRKLRNTVRKSRATAKRNARQRSQREAMNRFRTKVSHLIKASQLAGTPTEAQLVKQQAVASAASKKLASKCKGKNEPASCKNLKINAFAAERLVIDMKKKRAQARCKDLTGGDLATCKKKSAKTLRNLRKEKKAVSSAFKSIIR